MDYRFDVLDISTSESDLFVMTISIIISAMFNLFIMQGDICKVFSFISVSCCELLLNNEYD